MKKVIITIMILGCIVLSGCQNDADVGIIGGADGPTSIIVGNEKGSIKKPIRMIKADGKLYYDSGKVSELTPRCGTLDGELKAVGAEFEIPKNDNECNFSGAEGYQNATEITKEVPIDGEWVIFKLFDDIELDMDVYKYCFYIKGRTPNAKRDSEIVVLTENINYDFEEFCKLYSSQFVPTEKSYATTFRLYGDYDNWGVYLTADNVTRTGLTLVIEQFGGMPSGELQTGPEFLLEVMEDGKWKTIESEFSDYAWNSIAYKIKKNDITRLNIDWEWLYGSLPNGYYRLKKEICDYRTPGDFDEKTYDVYFTIE